MLLQFLFPSTFSQRSNVATSVPKYDGTWNHLPSESLPFVRYRSPTYCDEFASKIVSRELML